MFSDLFGTDNFLDMLGTPSFWYTLAIVIGVIVILITSIKHWNSGGKYILIGLFVVGNILLAGYSLLQINYYYTAEGGIHGAITGIFNTNEVKVVDNLYFEFKNIELTDKGNGIYSASITTDKVLNLDGQENIGVFVNELPCSYVEYAGDYVIAKYIYTFLDEDKSVLCTDTLTMNFAFYDNSTSLSISTSGGSEAVKYWHYYINKNEFKVRIGEADYVVSGDLEYADGDTSEWCVVKYVVGENVVCVQAFKLNSTIAFPVLDIKHGAWTIDGEEITEDFVVTENITIYAREIIEHTATFMVGSEIYTTKIVETETCVSDIENSFEYEVSEGTFIVVNGWLLDGESIDITTQKITSDVIFTADYTKEHLVTITNIVSFVDQRVKDGTCLNIEIPEYYVLEHFEVQDRQGNLIAAVEDLASYAVTQPLFIVPVGEYYYPVNYVVSETTISNQEVKYREYSVVPNNPELVGKEFLGWSLDGKTIIDPSTTSITGPTEFIAVFNDTEFTLTLEYKDAEYNTVTDTIVGKYQDTYTLPIPSLTGFTFREWVIEEGVGSVENGIFTFGAGDCKLIPSWNEIWIHISAPTSILSSVDYGDYTLNNTFTNSNTGFTYYELIADRSGSITLNFVDAKHYTINVDTDGEYTLTQNGTAWTLTWVDSSKIAINFSDQIIFV